MSSSGQQPDSLPQGAADSPLALVVLAIALATTVSGCTAPAGPLPTPDAVAISRMERVLGMSPPIRANVGMAMDDGGSFSIEFVDRRRKSLTVYKDNRLIMLRHPLRPTSTWLEDRYYVLREYWFHGSPESPGSVRILVGSAAESSVVDMLRAALAGAITAEHLDLLDREDAWVAATDLRGRIQREDILKRRTKREMDALWLRGVAQGLERRRDLLLHGTLPFTPAEKRERIRRELGLSPPYTLLSAGYAADGGSGIVHFTDSHGRTLWALVDARMTEHGIPPPVRYVYVHERLDFDGARQLPFSSPAESAVVDLMRFVLADESSRRSARMQPEDSRDRLAEIVGRVQLLPAKALESRAKYQEDERLERAEQAR